MASELLRKVAPRRCRHDRELPCTRRSIRPTFLPGVQQAFRGSNPASLLESPSEKKKRVESIFRRFSQKKLEIGVHYSDCYTSLHLFSSFTPNTKFLPRRPPEYRNTAYRSILCPRGSGAEDPLYTFWREMWGTGYRYTSAAVQKQSEVKCCGYAPQTLHAEGHCNFVSSEKQKPNFHPEAFVKVRGEYVSLGLLLENREVECHSPFGSVSSQKTQKRKNNDLPPAVATAYGHVSGVDSLFNKKETYERENFTAVVSPYSTSEFTTGNMSLSQYPLYCPIYSSTTARWDKSRSAGKYTLFHLGKRVQTRSLKQALKHLRPAVDKVVLVTYPEGVWEDYYRSPKSERKTLEAGSKQPSWAFPKGIQMHIEDKGFKQYIDNDAVPEGHLGTAKSKWSLEDSRVPTATDVILGSLRKGDNFRFDSSSWLSWLHAGLSPQSPQSHRNAMRDFLEKRTGIGCCTAVLYRSATCKPCVSSREKCQGKDTFKGHVEGDGRTTATNSEVIHCSDRKRKIMNGTEYIRRKTGHRGRIKRNSQAPAYKRK